MKKAKRNLIITAAILFGIAIIATIIGLYFWSLDNYGAYYYDYKKLKNNVTAVELIEYNATNAKMVYNKKDIGAFDFDKSETLQTLEQSRVDEFLRAFSKVKFFKDEKFPNTPIGRCIKLTYSNGDFLVVICYKVKEHEYCYGTHLYDQYGNIKEVTWLSNLKDFFKLCDDYFGEVE